MSGTGDAGGGVPCWSVRVRKRLQRRDGSHFELDMHFASHQPRVVLFGPSGAGKSRTLHMIAGTAKPQQGRIAVGGRVLFDSDAHIDVPARQRGMAVVFQDLALFPHLTVRQNIAFAQTRGLRNPSAQARDAAAEHWLQRLGLSALAEQFPQQLSGGQRQRAALARALVMRPSALLLDEPFAALDAALRRQLRQELLQLQRELQLPMLVITHDEDDAALLGQTLVRVRDGQVVDCSVIAAP